MTGSSKVQASMVEIYDNQAIDLLTKPASGSGGTNSRAPSPSSPVKKLRVREDPMLGPFADGKKSIAVTDAASAYKVFCKGSAVCRTCATPVSFLSC